MHSGDTMATRAAEVTETLCSLVFFDGPDADLADDDVPTYGELGVFYTVNAAAEEIEACAYNRLLLWHARPGERGCQCAPCLFHATSV